MSAYVELQNRLEADPKTWLITGVAGFIGSNLLETLLKLNQRVVGLDNFATGYQRNLDEVRSLVTSTQWGNFQLIQGDIRNLNDCRRAVTFIPSPTSGGEGNPRASLLTPHSARLVPQFSVDYVLHQAALGSVPRSIEDPIATNETNIDGFLNMLVAARDAKVKRFIYAASSSTYGDHPDLPKVEDKIGKPLSPYAVTKYVNELYADVFSRTYRFNAIGLRYFNVFGPRQDANGAYAAVIPKWTAAMIRNEIVYINGDGKTSRDFCYIENVVQANLLSAAAENDAAINQVFNIAVGDQTSLNALYEYIRSNLQISFPHLKHARPVHRDFSFGDVRHSQADIGKAIRLLGYSPTQRIEEGLELAMPWYIRNYG